MESEMQFLANENDFRTVEVPITIRYEDKPKRPVLQHGLLVLNGILRLVGQYRLLPFFGVSGVLLMLARAAGSAIHGLRSRNYWLNLMQTSRGTKLWIQHSTEPRLR
ncbi:MAG: hypothetical protein WA996_16155 [Candidatus Promineifilaceae bacterium]